jgi:hypothetical protein
MKPLNLDNRPCSPTSSDCVIWSGKDLPCINLCAGDSVTDVVFKLATELCTIMDQLNITNYDLSCFNLAACPPADFQALIQFLIEQICLLQGITTPGKEAAACPDCVVSVADCFIVGTQTTMQLIDYVNAIAERVCAIADEITVINNQIANLTLVTEDLQFQIDNLPVYTLPSIEVNCTLSGPGDYNVIGGGTYAIDLILQALINDPTYGYCSLLGSTGLPTDMLSAVAGACITASSPSIANPASTMGAEYSPDWINSPVTIADTIVNLWISLCDIRDGLSGLASTVVEAGDGIDVTSATVGSVTTYTVSTLGAMRAQSEPADMNNQTPTATLSLYFVSSGPQVGGVKQVMGEIYDDDNAYDPLTGIWTCPADGRYNLSFYVHMSNPDDGFTSGMVIAGIIGTTPIGYYAVNTMAITNVVRHIDITGQALGMNLNAGLQLQLNILNLTDVNYTTFVGDVARFVVQRVR